VNEPLVFEGAAAPECLDDSGAALILRVNNDSDLDAEEGEFVRLQSWWPDATHPRLLPIMGRRVRVTVEVLETVEEMHGRETESERLDREGLQARVVAYQENGGVA
jgi:hypothetical protein